MDNLILFRYKLAVTKKRSLPCTGKLQSYVGKKTHQLVKDRWSQMGYFSESDYIRDLVRIDLKKKQEEEK